MTNTNELTAKLKAAAQDEIMCREACDTSDLWQDVASPENVLELTEALEKREELRAAANKVVVQQDIEIYDLRQRIAELEARTLTVKLPAHKYRECVNGLLEEAIAYAGTQQLRERLSSRLANFVQPDHPHARCASAGIKLQIEGE